MLMSTQTHKTLVSTDEINAYLHTTRMAMIHALGAGPATCSQIAETLKVHPANLTRHIRVLEKAGLIYLKEKRDTGRNIEKYYALCADSFDVAPETADLSSLKKTALACAKSDLAAAIAALSDNEEQPVYAKLAGIRIEPSKAAVFTRELDALVSRFMSMDDEAGEPFRLNVSLYPGSFVKEGMQDTHIELSANKSDRKNSEKSPKGN
ncbi:MAG: helix-turn-helix transcriptional regulator [Spirochaetales bacterium]|nr:helix-turn-helix transcriptional regulator [Spirochaetales bacterium]